MGGMKLSVSLPDGLVARLDAARGLVPRSTWLAWVVEQALEGGPAGAVSGARVPPAPAEPPNEEWLLDPNCLTRVVNVQDVTVDADPAPPRRSPVARPHLPTCRCPVCR